MESRRRQYRDRNRRSQNRRPPRVGSWQPTMPSWEKEFCRVVGAIDWETLLQMKKFMHLYDNVLKWNDSAGKEAFCNAKQRFWAELNGLPCDISLSDPDLYIDKIDWDSMDSELQPDLEFEPVISNADEDHDPVVIFGDSLFPNQTYLLTGWGDDEENFKVPANSSSANHGGTPREQNWGNSFDSGAPVGWSGCSSNNAWHIGDGSGPAGNSTWGDGWNDDQGWNYANEAGHGFKHKAIDGEHETWNTSNATRVNGGRHVSSHRTPRIQGHGRYRNHMSRNHDGRQRATYWGQQSTMEKRHDSREWNSFNSCGPVSHNAAITVGQTWNQ